VKWLIRLFLIAHGLVHLGVWLPPFKEGAGAFNPGFSWVLNAFSVGPAAGRAIAVSLAVIATVAFVVTGFAMLGQQEWWRPTAVAAAVVSLSLIILCFNPWLSLAVALDGAILVPPWWVQWPSVAIVGS
jgi:hypothetical protein